MSAKPGSAVMAGHGAGATQLAHGYGSSEYGRMLERPGPGRPLLYPYTYMGKIFQMPWKLHWQRNWLFRYYIFGWIAGLPLILFIHRMANSPENVEKWKGIREDWRQGGGGGALLGG